MAKGTPDRVSYVLCGVAIWLLVIWSLLARPAPPPAKDRFARAAAACDEPISDPPGGLRARSRSAHLPP
jgi:hypothetical protein